MRVIIRTFECPDCSLQMIVGKNVDFDDFDDNPIDLDKVKELDCPSCAGTMERLEEKHLAVI